MTRRALAGRATLGDARRVSRALLVVALLLVAWDTRAEEPLRVGDPAPAFELVGAGGARHTLADFRGRRGLVLAWFPKAFTPG